MITSFTENIYSSDGFRLECDAPMRRWRLAFNGVMSENEEEVRLRPLFVSTPWAVGEIKIQWATLKETSFQVHVRFGIRWSAGGHAFEWPKQLSAEDFYNLNKNLSAGALLNAVDR